METIRYDYVASGLGLGVSGLRLRVAKGKASGLGEFYKASSWWPQCSVFEGFVGAGLYQKKAAGF